MDEQTAQPSTESGATILLEQQAQNVEPGDHERFSHFVQKDKIVESAVLGTPVVALCGKVWTPSRDPQKFPICPECKDIYESMPHGEEPGE